MRAFLLAPLLLLAACEKEPENIQAKAENQSRALENRYRELDAAAQNDTDAAIAPLDNEAQAALDALPPPEPPGNAVGNSAGNTR